MIDESSHFNSLYNLIYFPFIYIPLSSYLLAYTDVFQSDRENVEDISIHLFSSSSRNLMWFIKFIAISMHGIPQ